MSRIGNAIAGALCLGGLVIGQASGSVIVEDVQGLLKAKVTFTSSGSGANRKLTVTLANTSTNDITQPSEVLSAVYFKLTGTPANSLSPTSANAASANSIFFESPAFGGTDIGGEWCYKNGLNLFNGNVDQGISAAGLGIFGPSDMFGGPDRNSRQAPDGLDYALLSAGDDTSTGNAAVTGNAPLIKSSAIFVFSVPSTFGDANILANSIVFQYGTSPTEPAYGPGAPEPATLGLLGLTGLMFTRRVPSKRRQCD